MKLAYLFVFVSCFAANVFAQDKSTIPSISIPRTETNTPNNPSAESQYSISKPFVPEKFKSAPKFDPISMDKPMELKPQVSDLNVGKQFADKMDKQFQKEGSGDAKIFRRNQYFGEFVSESESLKIYYRDIGLIDGDKIRVWVDGKIVFNDIELDGAREFVQLGLIMGVNFIEIEAINDGVYFPNTGEVIFTEKEGKIISTERWTISAGYKATINIRRLPKGSSLDAKK